MKATIVAILIEIVIIHRVGWEECFIRLCMLFSASDCLSLSGSSCFAATL
jgi:hypothetical protein